MNELVRTNNWKDPTPVVSSLCSGNQEDWLAIKFPSTTEKGRVIPIDAFNTSQTGVTSRIEEVNNHPICCSGGMMFVAVFGILPYQDLAKPDCKLHNISWNSLLDGHRGPPKSTTDLHKRQQEAEILLTHVFGQTLEESITNLPTYPKFTSTTTNNNDTPAFYKTPAELLEFKNKCEITDKNWKWVVRFFKLGKGTTIHYVRQERQKINPGMEPHKVSPGVSVNITAQKVN